MAMNGAGGASSLPSLADEVAAVRAAFKNAIAEDEVWAVIDAKWWTQWLKYSGFDPKADPDMPPIESLRASDTARPGRIDNSKLHEGTKCR